MAKEFGFSEHRIVGLFKKGTQFRFRGRVYSVDFAQKPTCSSGEPKTDIFVRTCDVGNGASRDFKISYKQVNANFLENKIRAERARQIFGMQWSGIIQRATLGIRQEFERRPLAFFRPFKKTEAGSFTLGWKFELLNVQSGDLSGIMPLSLGEKIDVYAGSHLDEDKRHAYVGSRRIENSGIADYMLVSGVPSSAQSVVDSLEDVRSFAERSNIYFACKALNYRSRHNPPKWDGNRPLSVQVDWLVERSRLCAVLDFNHPLVRCGDEMGRQLRSALAVLKAEGVKDLTPSDCLCVCHM